MFANFVAFLKQPIVLLLNQNEMKKLVLLAAVVFSVSMIACGNKEQAAEAAEAAQDAAADAVETVQDTVVAVVDSITPDSATVVEAAAEVVEAVAE